MEPTYVYPTTPAPTYVAPAPAPETEKPTSVGDWMITSIVMAIPLVNIIMMFVWAFGSSCSKSKSNYFKAALIWALISIVLSIIAAVIMVIAGVGIGAMVGNGYR